MFDKKEYRHQYYLKNKNKVRRRQRLNYLNNRENVLKRTYEYARKTGWKHSKAWKKEHPEKNAEQMASWRRKNPLAWKRLLRRSYEKNRFYRIAMTRLYKIGVTVGMHGQKARDLGTAWAALIQTKEVINGR